MKKDVVQKVVSHTVIFIAIALLCLPPVSHLLGAFTDMYMYVPELPEQADTADVDYKALEEAARLYNDSLADAPLHSPTDEENERYMELMNITGTGVMGSVSIPKINVDLPIFHTVTDEVMQKGAGHMPGTSLPVESSSSHVVISAHSGLATAVMFTDLPELEIGDTFQITALRKVLVYEVDKIQTVTPKEVDKVAIEPGREYCTLITCTPLGINNMRLLVRGHRVNTIVEQERPPAEQPDFARELFAGNILADYEIFMLAIALILLLAEIIWPLAGAIINKKARKSE